MIIKMNKIKLSSFIKYGEKTDARYPYTFLSVVKVEENHLLMCHDSMFLKVPIETIGWTKTIYLSIYQLETIMKAVKTNKKMVWIDVLDDALVYEDLSIKRLNVDDIAKDVTEVYDRHANIEDYETIRLSYAFLKQLLDTLNDTTFIDKGYANYITLKVPKKGENKFVSGFSYFKDCNRYEGVFGTKPKE